MRKQLEMDGCLAWNLKLPVQLPKKTNSIQMSSKENLRDTTRMSQEKALDLERVKKARAEVRMDVQHTHMKGSPLGISVRAH
eukprot:3354390-Amphidinium_carterae.1